MSNTENANFQQQLQKTIEQGTPEELQKLLKQQAVDSGELTKAFAQAWANNAINGEDTAGKLNPGQRDGSANGRWLPSFSDRMEKKSKPPRGVRVNPTSE